jgi:cleavage and polyadenylation specificity factor subunit 4
MQQLKEILAKQAELGVEVAEIPPEYMLDSEKLGVEVAETPLSYLLDSEKLGVEVAEIPPPQVLSSEKLGVEVAEIPPPQVLNSEKLGVEVAEIPPLHLLDSEKQEHGREDNRRSLTKKGKFWNKHDKRGRFNKKGRSAKQVGSANEERKPTLLEKLLSTDIKRDKRQLLQVFRFMVANSFFKDWPEKPLKFPSVVVKEDGYGDEIVGKKSSLVGEEVSEDRNNTIAENFGDRDDNIEHDAQVELGNCFVGGKCDIVDEVDRVEEGEIVD